MDGRDRSNSERDVVETWVPIFEVVGWGIVLTLLLIGVVFG
jgi:hypothetical protein